MAKDEKPKYGAVVEGVDKLSIGISMVVAILLGIGLGLFMKNIFGIDWLLWLGVFWGVSGAILNIYKVYKKEVAGYDELAKQEKYQNYDDLKEKYGN